MVGEKLRPSGRAAINLAMLTIYLIAGGMQVKVLLQALQLLPTSHLHGPLVGSTHALVLLVAIEAAYIILMAYLFFCNVTRRLTPAQQHDWNLVFHGFFVPLANTAWHYALPNYDITTRIWPVFFAVQMTTGVAMCGMPPAHVIVDGLALMPPLM